MTHVFYLQCTNRPLGFYECY